MIYKFFNLGISIRWRSLKCGSTNSTNERIAEDTNEANKEISQSTNEANSQNVRNTNESNERMNRENNELQMRLQQEENEFNLRMWNLNNAYNTPENQLKRAAAAGINPNSVQIGNVPSSPVQQTSIAQTTPSRNESPVARGYTAVGATATPEGSIAGSLSRSIGDLNQSLNAVGQHYQNESQRMQNSFMPAMLASGLEGSNVSNELGRAQTKVAQEQSTLIMKQADGICQNILESQAKVRNMQAELNILNEKEFQSKIDSAFYYDEKSENLRSVQENNELTHAQTWAIGQRLRLDSMVAYATANKLNWEAKLSEQEKAWKDRCMELGMPEAEVNQVKSAVMLAHSQNTGEMLRNEVYGTYGADLMKYNVEEARYRTTTMSRLINGARDFMVSAGGAALILK